MQIGMILLNEIKFDTVKRKHTYMGFHTQKKIESFLLLTVKVTLSNVKSFISVYWPSLLVLILIHSFSLLGIFVHKGQISMSCNQIL